jgi:hypothetical protein
MISLSKYTFIKRVVVWKPHCITQYFVQKRRLAIQMNIQQCTHIAICKSIGKIMTQMENICCCGVALLVKLLTTIFLQVELFIYKKNTLLPLNITRNVHEFFWWWEDCKLNAPQSWLNNTIHFAWSKASPIVKLLTPNPMKGLLQ